MEQATRNGNEHFKAENWWLELEYNLPFWNLEFHPFSCELLVFWGEGSHCIYPTSFHIQALTAHFFPVHPQAEQLLHLKKIQCPKKLCLFWLKHHYCSSKVVKKNENSRVNMMTSDQGYCLITRIRHQERQLSNNVNNLSVGLKSNFTWIFMALLGGASPR